MRVWGGGAVAILVQHQLQRQNAQASIIMGTNAFICHQLHSRFKKYKRIQKKFIIHSKGIK